MRVIGAVAVRSDGQDRHDRDRSVSGRFEGLAALQATASVARGDESAEWAHALGREIADPWLHAQRSSQPGSREGTQTSQIAKERLQEGNHG